MLYIGVMNIISKYGSDNKVFLFFKSNANHRMTVTTNNKFQIITISPLFYNSKSFIFKSGIPIYKSLLNFSISIILLSLIIVYKS